MDSSFRPTRREADLSNLINNATARDELFARNTHFHPFQFRDPKEPVIQYLSSYH